MTNTELEAHIEMMASVRAERVLDMAQAAAYPLYLQHAPDHAKWWWQRLLDDVNDVLQEVIRQPNKRALFTFNGVAISMAGLKEKLGQALGRGLSA